MSKTPSSRFISIIFVAHPRNKSLEQHQGLQGVHLHIGSGLYDDRFLRPGDEPIEVGDVGFSLDFIWLMKYRKYMEIWWTMEVY